jgi:hypothetical protein
MVVISSLAQSITSFLLIAKRRQLLECFRKMHEITVVSRPFYNQVEMVGHQAVAVDKKGVRF